ncbi:MAG: NAD(+) diphosphatase [Ignavibacteria bacterium]
MSLGKPHQARYLRKDELNKDYNEEKFVFLGEFNNSFYFTFEVDEKTKQNLISSVIDFKELVNISPLLNKLDCSLLSLSRSLLLWHNETKFCGICGNRTKSIEGGFSRICINEKCKKQYFPRINPSIITLIYYGKKCLLGRQKIWPKGMYSTIAGFVELGESVESALKREVFEETGLKLKNIQYKYSDPWPFPASLMFGYFAEAVSPELNIDKEELEDCRWFSISELNSLIDSKEISLPRTSSISFRLISEWMKNEQIK